MSSTTCFATLIADRVLPQRDLLLDPDFVASLFSQKLGVSGPMVVDGCEHHSNHLSRRRKFAGGLQSVCELDGRVLLPDAHFRKAAAESALNKKSRGSQIAGHFGLCFTTRRRKVFSGLSLMTARLQTCPCWLIYRRSWRRFLLRDGPRAGWWLMRRRIALLFSA